MTVETFTSNGSYIAKAKTADVACEGSGGGGGQNEGVSGGGGGGGGAYAASTGVTTIIGHSYPIVADADVDASFNTTTVVAKKGSSSTNGTGAAGGTAAASTGTTKNNGGAGGNGEAAGAGGGGGGCGTAGGAGTAGAAGAAGVGGAGGTPRGASGKNAADSGQASDGEDGGGGGGCSVLTTANSSPCNGRVAVTYTSVVSLSSPVLDESGVTAVVDQLLDPNEVLTGTPGAFIVAPATAKYFTGFELVISQATTNIPFVVKDTNNVTLFTIAQGFDAGERINIHCLPIPVSPGFGIKFTGGGDNAIFNGHAFWI